MAIRTVPHVTVAGDSIPTQTHASLYPCLQLEVFWIFRQRSGSWGYGVCLSKGTIEVKYITIITSVRGRDNRHNYMPPPLFFSKSVCHHLWGTTRYECMRPATIQPLVLAFRAYIYLLRSAQQMSHGVDANCPSYPLIINASNFTSQAPLLQEPHSILTSHSGSYWLCCTCIIITYIRIADGNDDVLKLRQHFWWRFPPH